MESTVYEYDAKVDAKKRITLREAGYQYYHVQELNNGTIMLFPRVLTAPAEFSAPNLQQGTSLSAEKRTAGTDIASQRIGIAKGRFTVPDEFDDWDQEIMEMFDGKFDSSLS